MNTNRRKKPTQFPKDTGTTAEQAPAQIPGPGPEPITPAPAPVPEPEAAPAPAVAYTPQDTYELALANLNGYATAWMHQLMRLGLADTKEERSNARAAMKEARKAWKGSEKRVRKLRRIARRAAKKAEAAKAKAEADRAKADEEAIRRSDFIQGFADESQLDTAEAEKQWAEWSKSLSGTVRRRIERLGSAAGKAEAREWRANWKANVS